MKASARPSPEWSSRSQPPAGQRTARHAALIQCGRGVYLAPRPAPRSRSVEAAILAVQRFVCRSLRHAEQSRQVFSRCRDQGRAYEGVANQAIWESLCDAAIETTTDPSVDRPFFSREYSITLPCAHGGALRRRVDFLIRLPGSNAAVTALEIKALKRSQGPGSAAKGIRQDIAKMQFLMRRGLVGTAVIACFGLGLTQDQFEDRVTNGAGALRVSFPQVHPAICVAFVEVDTVHEV